MVQRRSKPSHVPGTQKGEELKRQQGPEPGRDDRAARAYRTARDSTSIDPSARDPIDPKMPNIPPP